MESTAVDFVTAPAAAKQTLGTATIQGAIFKAIEANLINVGP
ncbi:MAG: hypothetical protein ACOY99_11475 [Pseudomonadota bacterium]